MKTIIVAICLTLIGFAFLPLLTVKLSPSEKMPSLNVYFSMGNATSKVVESEVTCRLEAMFARMSGVEDISSTSRNGGGDITVKFNKHVDIDAARFEASTLVRQLWQDLPEGTSYPVVSVAASGGEDSERSFMAFTINAIEDSRNIYNNAEKVFKAGFSELGDISAVNIYGADNMEWNLEYDYQQLASLGISVADIRNAIGDYRNKQNIGKYLVKAGNADSAFSLSEIYVPAANSQLIPLSSLARMSYERQRPWSIMRINGLNSIYMELKASGNANQLELQKLVMRKISQLKSLLPYGYEVHKIYDATERISEELNRIYFRSSATVAILLIFVFLTSFSWRQLIVVVCSLICNLAVAVVVYYLLDVELQLYSLAAITISLNLMIDNTIIMTDHWRRCHNVEAILPIVAATLTTIGALSVVFFLDDRLRLNLFDFAVVMIVNLLLSVFTALWLVPAILSFQKEVSIKSLTVKRLRLAANINGFYRKVVDFSVRWRWMAYVLLIVSFGGSLKLFVDKVVSGSYWQVSNEVVLSVYATLPYGSTIDQMDFLMRRMESYISQFPEVRQFKTNLSATTGYIEIRFTKEAEHGSFPYQLKSNIISKGLQLGGGSWSVWGLQDNGFSNNTTETVGTYKLDISGYNYETLLQWSDSIRNHLLSYMRIKEVSINAREMYYKDDYVEYRLQPNKDFMAQQNLTAGYLFYVLPQIFVADNPCGLVWNGNCPEVVKLRTSQSQEYDIWSLLNRPVEIAGRIYKLSQLCTFEKLQAPSEIVKQNQQYKLCIQYEYIGSASLGNKILKETESIYSARLPIGYNLQAGYSHGSWSQEESRQYWLLGLVLLIIFLTTSILFNSLKLPFVIILSVPVSYVGLFLTFYLFGLNFDQGGFASLILLCGITVNASIYIVNEYRKYRTRYSEKVSYLKAFNTKIIPIMLTILSTILGFVPFMAGDIREAFWFPLAAGTVGGLVMSIVGIWLFLPAFLVRRKS